MQPIMMNVISIGVMIYSFWFKAYPVKIKLTNPIIPAMNTDNENFSKSQKNSHC